MIVFVRFQVVMNEMKWNEMEEQSNELSVSIVKLLTLTYISFDEGLAY